MKVLTITNMWPIPEHQYFGIFVKEQVEGLKKYYPHIVNKVWFINGFKNKLNYFLSVININYHLLFNEYDVIHIHFGLSGLFLLLNPFLKIPIVTMIHGSDINKKNNRVIYLLTKLVIKKSTHVIILNNNMKDEIKDLNNNISHIPCGVNTHLFTYISNKIVFDDIKIAFPGSPKRLVKNYKLFINIINILKTRYNINISIVKIDKKTREEVSKILNEIDLLIMTSISEGSPQIIKEAMCCNTPIVSSNVGDVHTLLEGVNNCHIVNSFDEEDFVKATIEIINTNTRERVTNGRLRIFELGLDEKKTSEKIFTIYKTLIK